MINISAVTDVVHYFVIKVLDNKRNKIEFLNWHGLRWELRLKYDWYFKYRAALLQVKYPKFKVEIHWGNEPATGKTLDQIRAAKLISKKSGITKAKNKLAAYKFEFECYKRGYSGLFPIEQEREHKRYAASIELAEEKIKRLEGELECI